MLATFRRRIELIAITDIKIVTSENPRPLANYSEAMLAGGMAFAAGQLFSDFKTGVPAVARKHPNFPY
jgi:enamine deaminase RidA (YjgF/YER057c/UK114 family)